MHQVIAQFVDTSESPFGQLVLRRMFEYADKDGNGSLDKEEVWKRKADFDVVAFAVFNAGYTGNDNFGVFRESLGGHES